MFSSGVSLRVTVDAETALPLLLPPGARLRAVVAIVAGFEGVERCAGRCVQKLYAISDKGGDSSLAGVRKQSDGQFLAQAQMCGRILETGEMAWYGYGYGTLCCQRFR